MSATVPTPVTPHHPSEPADPTERQRQSYHLAGHAVVALLRGRLYRKLELHAPERAHVNLIAARALLALGDDIAPKPAQRLYPGVVARLQVQLLLAGPLAERKAVRRGARWESTQSVAGWESDLRAICKALAQVPAPSERVRWAILEIAKDLTESRLTLYWPLVEAVATELRCTGSLDALRLLELVTFTCIEKYRPFPPHLRILVELEHRDALRQSTRASRAWCPSSDPELDYGRVQNRLWRLENLLLSIEEHEARSAGGRAENGEGSPS